MNTKTFKAVLTGSPKNPELFGDYTLILATITIRAHNRKAATGVANEIREQFQGKYVRLLWLHVSVYEER